MRAALDGVPDPVNGLLVYRGRGGAAGPRSPRRPRPAPGAAALELQEPREQRHIRLRALREELLEDAVRRVRRDADPGEPARHGALSSAACA